MAAQVEGCAVQPAAPQPLSFSDFLEKMKEPQAADLVRGIKTFIKQFEERGSGHRPDPETDSTRVQDFMARMEQQFRAHPVWRGSRPEVMDQAAEGLEKYLMSKIWRETFGVGQEDRDRDERYTRLMAALSFVDLPTLMGLEQGEVEADPALLELAVGELLKVERYKAPRDKLLCLVNVKTMVEGIVAAAAAQGANIGGADAFFPVFLYIVLRSRLPRLASNVEYVKRFRGTARLSGQFDYMLCNLESAAMYLDTVNYKDLRISQHEFLRRLSQAGIPEADIELRSLQRQQQAAAAAAAAVAAAGAEEVPAVPQYAAQGETIDAVVGSCAAIEAPADALAGADSAAGSELLDMQPSSSSGGQGLLDSLPATPGPASSTAELVLAPEQASAVTPSSQLSELTPGRQPTQSPQLVQPQPGQHAGVPEAAPSSTALAKQQQQQRQPAVPSPSALARRLQYQRAAAAAGLPLQLEEPAFVTDMVADGTRHVLEAEASGQLQLKYPYMYASAADLSLADVDNVLAAYKELLLRYEALALSLKHQLMEDSVGGTPGFGSFFIPGQGEALPNSPRIGGRSLTAPLEASAVGAAAAAGRVHASEDSEDVASGSPSRWSPSSLLQRISSKGRSQQVGRSSTPTRADDQSPSAEGSNAGGAFSDTLRSVSPVARLAATGKQVAQHPLFNTVFGRPLARISPPKAAKQQQQQQGLEQPARQEDEVEAVEVAEGPLGAHLAQVQQQQAAVDAQPVLPAELNTKTDGATPPAGISTGPSASETTKLGKPSDAMSSAAAQQSDGAAGSADAAADTALHREMDILTQAHALSNGRSTGASSEAWLGRQEQESLL